MHRRLLSSRILPLSTPSTRSASTCLRVAPAARAQEQLIRAALPPCFHSTLVPIARSRAASHGRHHLWTAASRCWTAQTDGSDALSSPHQSSHLLSAPLSSDQAATVEHLYEGLMTGDRASLARAITLVESAKRDHKRLAQVLLAKVLDALQERNGLVRANHDRPMKGHKLPYSFRVGLSGPPGAGKSTFIEAMGCFLTSKGFRVAVLAVDPSSSRSGGSILGDKTRMIELSRNPSAYVRPSPSRGSLGGVARNTSEAISLCEGAGYEVIIIETVGVGQSEVAVADMVDMFTLIVPPGGGDELQGIKKGIVELADLVIVNKADGDLLVPARKAKADYTSALKLLQPHHPLWSPQVTMLSSLESTGLELTWQTMLSYFQTMIRSGELHAIRCRQRKILMWRHISEEIMDRFKEHPAVSTIMDDIEARVSQGLISPGMAADELMNRYEQHK